MRITGLASGMDIDSIVAKLMKAERMPLDKLTQQKQTLEWQRDQYRDMNKLLDDLSQNIFNGIYLQANFMKQKIVNSNTAAVDVSNISSTNNITNQLSITQLAKNASMYSQTAITADPTFDPNATINSQITKFTNQVFSANTFTIQAVQADGTLGAAQTVTFDPAVDSLNTILGKISSTTDATAFYDAQTQTVSIGAKNSGDVGGTTVNDTANAEIVIGGAGADFLTNVLQMGTTTNTTAAAAGHGVYGLNAEFTLNGLQTYRASNTFTVNGYQYTLKNTTGATPVTISSTTDTDSIYNMITDFITKYNDTIDKINGKIDEPKYRNYLPLTDEQKSTMTDTQIKLWEDKAKSGLLRYDSTLTTGLDKMRQNLYNNISGLTTAFGQLGDIGIETSSNYLDHGKLVIKDDAKLRSAIASDPMAVYNLFNKEVKNPDGTLNYTQSGIARRLKSTIDSTITNVETKAGNVLKTMQQYTIGQNLIDVNDRIITFQDRLTQIESRYYKEFIAMEQAVQASNQQAAFLQSKFGG